eukprot:c19911_g1_i2.p1 GENE.c19911_g1_i2~~c19911_g1_i2.p1  ORF type:complete len:1226 (+),score=300.56 c19911_g1_i2:1-3678(+)
MGNFQVTALDDAFGSSFQTSFRFSVKFNSLDDSQEITPFSRSFFAVPTSFVDRAANQNLDPSNAVTINFGASPVISSVSVFETTNALLFDTVYGNGDTIEITFARSTNTAGVCASCDARQNPNFANTAFDCRGAPALTPAQLDQFLTFSTVIGADYDGHWQSCVTLVITIRDATGRVDNAPISIFAVDKTDRTNCDRSVVTGSFDGTNLRALQDSSCRSPPAQQATDPTKVSFRTAFGTCVHGVAGEDKKCVCEPNFIGKDCSVSCVVANTNLTLGSLPFKEGQCICLKDFHGPDCSFHCIKDQGTFVQGPPQQCFCTDGFVGDACGTPCGPGTFDAGSTCEPCPAGSFSSSTINSVCIRCNNNTFASAGSTGCTACPANTHTRELQSQQLDCEPNEDFFRLDASLLPNLQERLQAFQLVPCEPNRCKFWGGVDFRKKVKGDGTQAKDVFDVYSLSHDMLWCDQEQYDGFCVQCKCEEGLDKKDRECYTGHQCVRCVTGYYQSGAVCLRCPESQTALMIVFGAALFGFFAFVSQTGSYFMSIGAISIGFNFFQLFTQFIHFQVKLPAFLTNFFQIFSVFAFQIDLVQPECRSPWLRKFENRILVTIVFPALVLVGLVLLLSLFLLLKYCHIRYLIFRKLWKSKDRGLKTKSQNIKEIRDEMRKNSLNKKRGARGRKDDRFKNILQLEREGVTYDITSVMAVTNVVNTFAHVSLTFLSIVYMTLVQRSLTPFDCTHVSELDEWRLDAEPSIQCFVTSGPWLKMCVAGIFGLVFYVVGIPALFMALLLRNKRRLESATVTHRYGFLYKRFAYGYFMWELCVIARKFLFTVVQTFSNSHNELSMTGCSFVLFAFILWHVYAQPYATSILNKLEGCMLVGNYVVLNLLLQFNNEQVREEYGGAISLIVVIIVIGLGVVLAWVILIEVRRRARDVTSKVARAVLCISGDATERRRVHVMGLADGILNSQSMPLLNSWLKHHALYSETLYWAHFLKEFRSFVDDIKQGKNDRLAADMDNVASLNSELLPYFWLWVSKSERASLVNLSRALTQLRLYKRWQMPREQQVLMLIMDTLSRAQLKCTDPRPVAQRWYRVRKAVMSGRWRVLYNHTPVPKPTTTDEIVPRLSPYQSPAQVPGLLKRPSIVRDQPALEMTPHQQPSDESPGRMMPGMRLATETDEEQPNTQRRFDSHAPGVPERGGSSSSSSGTPDSPITAYPNSMLPRAIDDEEIM